MNRSTTWVGAAAIMLAAAIAAPAMAQKAALVRNIDRIGNANGQVFSCDGPPSACQWNLGPVTSPGAKFIVAFVSYKLRYNAATKVTSVGFFCGPGVDYLPLGQATTDDAGNTEVSWGGLVTRVFDPGCAGGGVYEHSGPDVARFEMRVHGYFEAPFP